MAVANVRTGDRRTDIAGESPYGTAGTFGTIRPTSWITPEVMETNIDNTEESPFLFDKLNPIRGLKSAKCTVQGNVRATSALLDEGATAIATPADMSLFPLVMGGENSSGGYFPDGSTVQATSSVSSIIFNTGDGSKVKKGQPFLVESASGSYDWAIVGSISTDTITPAIQPSGVYVTGKIINTACWYFTPANTNSISLRTSLVSDSNAQWLLRGGQCPDAFKLTIERDKQISWEFPLEFADWSRGALGYATSIVPDTQGPRFVAGQNAKCILQATSTLTKTNYSIESLTVNFKSGMTTLPEIAGDGIQGCAGWMRTAGRDLSTLTIKGRFDTAIRTLYDNQTQVRFVYAVPYGSGLTQRWFFVVVNRAVIADITKDMDEGGRLVSEVTLSPQIDTSSTDEFISTPIIIAVA
ncbi:MAG: hypothetical protein E6Q97_36630 [Desulfurellales bacterium]|nr:MAG: hypothetical protein E6Q97_36630 [Desulfurellales bacterium]